MGWSSSPRSWALYLWTISAWLENRESRKLLDGLRQMDPETRMGAKWPLHECCMNVATTSQIIYWSWCFEKEELRISLSTSRILSSSQYHWPWSVYCAAVWLYICTKPRKDPHDTHIFFADAYHIRVNMWTHTVYIYIYSLYCTYLHLKIHAQHCYVCTPLYLSTISKQKMFAMA